MKSCKNCPFEKCISKTKKDFLICPVEERKQELSKDDK